MAGSSRGAVAASGGACALFRRLVGDEAHWNAFGFIAAETELARGGGPCRR